MVHCSLSQGGVWFVLNWKVFWVLLDSSSPLFWSTHVPAPSPSVLSMKTEETTEETNPSAGRSLSVSSQWVQASVPERLNRVSTSATASRRSGLESTQTRTRSTSAFGGAASCDGSFLVMAVPNALRSAEFWQRICTPASLVFPFYLTRPPRRALISAFPWTAATRIAQVCCAVLKTWQWALRNTWVFSICISLNPHSPPPPDVPLAPLLFWSSKYAFSSASNFQRDDYFSLRDKDLPLILKIITLQCREGELCIRWLPAVRCMWTTAFHSEKVIAETGLFSL